MSPKKFSDRSKKNRAGASSALAPRLAAYSATAAAALAIAPAAQSQVIPITSFTYAGSTTTTPPSFTLPAKGGDLTFFAGPFAMSIQGNHEAKVRNVYFGATAVIRGDGSGHNSIQFADLPSGLTALKMAPGSIIKLQTHFATARLAARGSTHTTYIQPFQPHASGAVTGYVGFRATNAGHNYYGWLNIKVTADANGLADSVSIVAAKGTPGIFGAYDISTDPNINSFGASSIPEPSDAAFGLGLLAFGAAGVRQLRRRKQAVKA